MNPLATNQAFLQPSDFTAYIHLPLTGLWPLGRSINVQTLWSERDFISFCIAIIHEFCSCFESLSVSRKCLGREPDLTAMLKSCLIHLKLYICPRSLSSSLVRVTSIVLVGSSWIVSRPLVISLSISTAGLSPCVLSERILGTGMRENWHCSGTDLKVDCSFLVGWCWWGCDLNSGKVSSGCWQGGNQIWGRIPEGSSLFFQWGRRWISKHIVLMLMAICNRTPMTCIVLVPFYSRL